jgi:hypothetical protein
MNMRRCAWPVAALSLGCVQEAAPEGAADTGSMAAEESTGSEPDSEPRGAQFYEDIAPVLAASCTGCHREGGVAPFALETYEDAHAWAEAIAISVAARTMPPFSLDNDGSCNHYRDARWLEDEEIDLLAAWAEAGAPEGDASLGVPRPPEPAALAGDRILTLTTPEGYRPTPEGIEAAMHDDYQCFLLDPQLEEDAFLVGFDVEPGDARVVHHVLAFNVDPTRMINGRSNADLMAELDAESPDRPGWDCFAAAGDGVWVESIPVTWAPGTGATHYPDGTGIRLAAGQQIVVQMHYSLMEHEAESDGTDVRLELVDSVAREGTMVLVDGFLLSLLTGGATLPPGEASTTFSWDMAVKDVPNLHMDLENAELLGILPHMHQRGRTMQIDLLGAGDGEARCAGRVERWDFSWQQAYFYETALPVRGDDRLAVTCEWDTRGDAAPVGPGFGSDAEMCLVGLYLAERG